MLYIYIPEIYYNTTAIPSTVANVQHIDLTIARNNYLINLFKIFQDDSSMHQNTYKVETTSPNCCSMLNRNVMSTTQTYRLTAAPGE